MEFDETLSLLQGTLCSLENQGLLNKKESLQVAVESLEKITRNLSDEIKSKSTFFLVLNSRLSISEELKDDEFVGLFVNITPFIEVDYLIEYIYHLNLQEPLFKVLENCPGKLTIQLMDSILQKLSKPSFHKDEFGWNYFYQLWQSVFVKICKISNKLHDKDHLMKFIYYFQTICDLIQKILVTFMKTKGFENILGLHLLNFFKSFLFCLKMHKNHDLFDDPLYKLSIKFQPEEIEVIDNPVENCFNLIFSAVVKILENLTLDLWMTLAECYCCELDSRSSIQLLIGNVIYEILEEVKTLNAPSDVTNCLASLAINKLTSAELEEIILNINNGEKEWFQVLLKHPKFTENQCIKCIKNNINLANSNDLEMILTLSYDHICNAAEDKNLDLMKDLFLTGVKNSLDQSEWVKKVFNGKPGLLATAHTQDDLTETFNKISKEKNLPKEELISLCLQSPSESLIKIFQLAVNGSFQLKDVTEVLKVVQHPCKDLPDDGCACVDCVLLKFLSSEELTEKEKKVLVDLVVLMEKENLLGPQFPRTLMKALKAHLENCQLEKAVFCLKILKVLINSKYLVLNKPAVLVYLSQVLGHFSWDLESFTTIKADGRDLIISIVPDLIKALPDECERKYSWALKEILKIWEVNGSCFCELWFGRGRVWPSSGRLRSCLLALAHTRHKRHDLIDFLVNLGDPVDVRASVVLSLAEVLPVVTFPEWNSIFEALILMPERGNFVETDVRHYVLDMLASCLYLITLNLTGEAMYPCYEYCLRNLGRLMRRNFSQMKEKSFVETFSKVFFIVTAVEDKEERKCCWMIFLPVLLELIDWLRRKNSLDTHRSQILKNLAVLDSTDLAETLKKSLF